MTTTTPACWSAICVCPTTFEKNSRSQFPGDPPVAGNSNCAGTPAGTIRQVRARGRKPIADLEEEQGTLKRDIARHGKALKQHLAAAPGSNGADLARRQDDLRRMETRPTKVRKRGLALSRERVDEREAVQALSLFEPVWESLTPREQARVVRPPVERVDYDGRKRRSTTMPAFGDVHIPHQNETAAPGFYRAAKRLRPDRTMCLGDRLDCGQFSVHPPTYRMKETNYVDDPWVANPMLDHLQKVRDRLVIVEGNHE